MDKDVIIYEKETKKVVVVLPPNGEIIINKKYTYALAEPGTQCFMGNDATGEVTYIGEENNKIINLEDYLRKG